MNAGKLNCLCGEFGQSVSSDCRGDYDVQLVTVRLAAFLMNGRTENNPTHNRNAKECFRINMKLVLSSLTI